MQNIAAGKRACQVSQLYSATRLKIGFGARSSGFVRIPPKRLSQ
jgi:hypothetical protein